VTPYKELAEICSARFDRKITCSAIGGMIYRLRRKGLLPPARQQSARAPVCPYTPTWETNSAVEPNGAAAPPRAWLPDEKAFRTATPPGTP
jgi:hypothetical protein